MTATAAPVNWRELDDTRKAALVERLRQLAYEKRRSSWEPYPWQHPHVHPEGRPKGPCDAGCLELPDAPVPTHGTWLMLGGRGTGKTDGCAVYMDDHVMNGPPCDPRAPGGHRMSIVAPTMGDAAEACVLGISGLRAHNPAIQLKSTPGGTKAVWPNGAEARLMGAYTPEDVERLRAGGNRCLIWLEEVAAMRRLEDVLEHTALGLRVGPNPHYIASTTPKARPQIKAMRDDPATVLTSGKTRDATHLDAEVKATLERKYGNSRKGAQELDGVLLEDIEGALWKWANIERDRVINAPPGLRIVVAVDPAASNTEESDETGILVVGCDAQKEHGYVLDDLSGRYDPEEWARIAVEACTRWSADYIIGERNNGGDMVKATIRAYDRTARYRDVTATRGKALRAEPISVMYEQHRVHHVGTFVLLEEQQVTWTPEDADSMHDDRLDALVYGLTDLMVVPDRKRGGNASAA